MIHTFIDIYCSGQGSKKSRTSMSLAPFLYTSDSVYERVICRGGQSHDKLLTSLKGSVGKLEEAIDGRVGVEDGGKTPSKT
jgi:hypothetical protein